MGKCSKTTRRCPLNTQEKRTINTSIETLGISKVQLNGQMIKKKPGAMTSQHPGKSTPRTLTDAFGNNSRLKKKYYRPQKKKIDGLTRFQKLRNVRICLAKREIFHIQARNRYQKHLGGILKNNLTPRRVVRSKNAQSTPR